MIITAIKRTVRYLKVRDAVNHANRMSQTLNREHFVIQVGKHMRVYDHHQVKRLIADKIFKPSLGDLEVLRRACVYTTFNIKKKEQSCTSQKKTS